MMDLEFVFSGEGPLARAIPGFRARPQQLEMARAVQGAIERSAQLIVEAGTGTGKTLAYLVPALVAGGKVIISTGTKTLQDQLFQRDIPAARAALGLPISVAMLKGRANYVCHYHLERAASEGRFVDRQDLHYLPLIQNFAKHSSDGDRAGLPSVPENATIWPMVTSTRENCLGQDCPHHSECFVVEARKKAMDADVVVVNHHLFFADVMLRDEGAGELLPACNTVIFDEAHQLPETASLFFGDTLSTNQLNELAQDVKIETAASAKDCATLPDAAQRLEKRAKDLRIVFPEDQGRLTAQTVIGRAGFREAYAACRLALEELAVALKKQAERSAGLDNCRLRGEALLAQMSRWMMDTEDAPAEELDSDDGSPLIRWVELFHHVIHFHATPLSVARLFRKAMAEQQKSWIFTSATLSVNRNFNHYQIEMGLGDADTAHWDSPFDYPGRSVLYVPTGLPNPNHPAYNEKVVRAAFPVLKASRGRAFFLFTSLRALREAHTKLTALLAEEKLDYPLLVQGDGTRSALLERFRSHGNAILLGSQSFWEGVDVRGEALSLVIIDRLPFSPPDDPVLAARIEAITRQGRNAFMAYQVPRAAITLKQGAGRLIRDETDRGVLMICDPRLVEKPYGRQLWQSLPPMRRTRRLEEVIEFFDATTAPANI